MILAVTNIDRAVAGDKDSMRSRELAVERLVAIGTIAFLAVSDQQFNGSSFHVDVADGMGLGIGEVDVACSIQSDAFGTSECRFQRRSTIARES